MMRLHQVQALLMGGQACVLYGAAEFSRDTDFAILAEAANLSLLQAALDELQAICIAVPPFDMAYLKRGHSVHFRCRHPEAAGLRVDVMAVMRGVAPFPVLWERRTTVESEDGESFDLLALPDLVKAKKTQRDKDWPMIRRMLEAHYFQNRSDPSPEQINFWFCELRTPELLQELALLHPRALADLAPQRRVLDALQQRADEAALETALRAEEDEERARDRIYWQPLKAELEMLRRTRRSFGQDTSAL